VGKDNFFELIEEYCIMKNDKKCLACSDASKIAEALKISLTEVGKLCNEHGIKIMSCQLGCF